MKSLVARTLEVSQRNSEKRIESISILRLQLSLHQNSVRWPSWLWRQVKVNLNTNFLVEQSSWVRVPVSSRYNFCLLTLLSSQTKSIVFFIYELDSITSPADQGWFDTRGLYNFFKYSSPSLTFSSHFPSIVICCRLDMFSRYFLKDSC